MGKIIEAVYEKGVFRPLQKVELKEGERVLLRIDDRKGRREEFLKSWKLLSTGRKITAEELRNLRLEKYESVL
ncbi:MAG: antitoxin family protein [Archaeoglobi archaeon]|nr:antitoxin family protein [Candidatus Mnemosynella bozhongmuii]